MRTNVQTRKMLRHNVLTKDNGGINKNEIDKTIYVLMNNRKNTDYAVKIQSRKNKLGKTWNKL